MKFIVYRNSDGMILRTGEFQEGVLASQAGAGETAISGTADDILEYISGGSVTSRPVISATWNKTSIIANGIDSAILGSALPNPTSVLVSVPPGATLPPEEIVVTGSFSFATPIAGSYTIKVIPPFPYQPHEQVIIAS
jgi:hypothetical protein